MFYLLGQAKAVENASWEAYRRQGRSANQSQDWEGNTRSVLTFTGLFAATVAAFVIETCQCLSPDSGDPTVTLLTQVPATSSNNSSTNDSSTRSGLAAVFSGSFQASSTIVATSILKFSSLLVALVCTLRAKLAQQGLGN
ncbi:hypothetical protein PENSPDRAFT_34182 [Peniophora sp. CONT]|nr:hypothetical protein PENSPDRAFT_34182 [Peniophora sp. CONT]